MLVSGGIAAARWLRIVIERRRHQEEEAEHEQQQRSRKAAYESWKSWLDENRPTEEQMAAWLDADRTVLLDRALREYKLQPRDLVRYAVLETPYGRKRACARKGPWRYARYRFRLFLLTAGGVRVYTTVLDFVDAKFGDVRHTVFGFDAITSADLAMADGLPRTLELRLMDGRNIEVCVTGEESDQDTPQRRLGVRPEPGAGVILASNAGQGPCSTADASDPYEAVKLALEASGLPHTLHVLEGIAAEGRQWLQRQRFHRATGPAWHHKGQETSINK